MKLSWVSLLLIVALARAQEQQQEQEAQQITFGVTTGQQVGQQQDDSRPPTHPDASPARGATGDDAADESITPLTFSSTRSNPASTVSGSDLHSLSLSLLSSLTSHASPPPPTSYTPLLQPTSASPILDFLESSLGTTVGGAIRGVRNVIGNNLMSSGRKGAKRWSLRSATNGLKNRLPSLGRKGDGSGYKKGDARGTRWREKLEAMTGLRGGQGGVLDLEEVVEAMEEVVRLAKEAGEHGSAEGWVLLGDLYLTGHLTLEPDPKSAMDAYTKASEGWGSPEAQYKLGFLYASNFGGAAGGIEGSGQQGSALLHYTFAALSSHVPASMTVGYRHWVGIGTKQSCRDALGWYKAAADHAMRTFNAGPPGGRHLPPPKLRLSDLKGGAYGPGASSSFRPQYTGGSTSQTLQEWDDLLEFHAFHADRKDPKYMFHLGRLYYQGFGGEGLGGGRGGRGRLDVGAAGLSDGLWEGGRDFRRASKWFMQLATGVWPKDPSKEVVTNPKRKPRTKGDPPELFYDGTKDVKAKDKDEYYVMVAGLAAGYLGKMYLRGEGASVNYPKAFLWFQRGVSQSDRESNNGLGIMYRDGLGVERDLKKANLYFTAAAQQDLAEAQVNLGKYHFGTGDFVLSKTYFELAIRHDGIRTPDTFQSYYYLAELNARSLNRADQCPSVVSFYKLVAERGDWDHEVWWEAERALGRGDERSALLGYWIMAERGYEQAQNNVAWILDRDKQRLRLPFLDSILAPNQTDRLALAYWTRSAAQDNVDALVKMGDYYYAGIGTPAAEPQLEKAAACYLSAVNTRVNAMAMWNLGWMHEHGKGVARDFHMAKRYYDLALETSLDAYFPATLSLITLYARAIYHVLFTSSDDELQALALFRSTADPFGSTAQNDPYAVPPELVGPAPWSLGRTWREVQRRWGIDPGPEPPVLPPGHPPTQAPAGAVRDDYGRMRREDLEEAQRALEAEDAANDWSWRRGERVGEEEEDDFFMDGEGDLGGTVAIVALCVILGWLLYFRQGQVAAEPHRPGQQPVPAAGAAAPPPAGDAAQPPPPPEQGDEDEQQRLV